MGMPGLVGRASERKMATAATIAPNADVVVFTDNAVSIATIIPPNTGGVSDGVLILVAANGALTLVATGNIALAGTVAANTSKMMVYSQTQKKWY